MFSTIKNVAKHSVIYGLSDILSRSIGFLMIPLYTHYLTTADYGALELLDLIGYIVGLFLAMGISQAVFRHYYQYDDEEKREQVISVAMITLWVASAAVLAGLLMVTDTISNIVFKSPDYSHMFRVLFITLVIQLSNRIPLGMLRIEQKSVLFVTINITKLVITLSLNILFIVHFGMGIMGILLSSLIASSFAGIYLLFYILRKVRFSYSFEILISMLKYGFPLMWSWFGMFILHYGDRFLLQHLASLSDVGIYSLAYKFGALPNVLVLSPFLMVWEPKRFDLMKEPDAKNIYSVIFTYFMFVEIYMALGIAVLIKDVITLVAAPAFQDAYKYVSLILVAYVIYGAYMYVQFGIHYAKKTKYLAYSALIGAALNIGLNYFLIVKIQVWGAAVTTLVCFLFLLVYIYVPSQRLYHVPYEFNRLIKMSLIALMLYIVASILNPPNIYLSLIVKFTVAFLFPFVLYLVKFYTPRELAKMAKIRGRIRDELRARKVPLFRR